MLAQSFLSAAELGISEEQKEALIKTLVLLEMGKLRHRRLSDLRDLRIFDHPREFTGDFNMAVVAAEHSCGTVCCIIGTAEAISGVSFEGWSANERLNDLGIAAGAGSLFFDIEPTQAARALRSYLNCGDAKWHEAVAPSTNPADSRLKDEVGG